MVEFMTSAATLQTKQRTPLMVSALGMQIGESARSVEGPDNDSLFVAYLDFLGELRSSSPTIASLRVEDIEVLSQVTGLTDDDVRAELHRCLLASRPKRLTRRARAGVFATFGVAALGGVLAIASVVTAGSSGAVTRLEIGSAVVIERAVEPSVSAVEIGDAVTIERTNDEITVTTGGSQKNVNIEIGTALTIER
jgi:hypothetical protein